MRKHTLKMVTSKPVSSLLLLLLTSTFAVNSVSSTHWLGTTIRSQDLKSFTTITNNETNFYKKTIWLGLKFQ